MNLRTVLVAVVLDASMLLLSGCDRTPVAAAPATAAIPAGAAVAVAVAVAAAPSSPLSPAAQIGKAMFFDVRLSASGRQSCASCHDPAHAYAPANALAVQLGGPNLDQPGTRAVPSLMYKEYTLAYSDRYENPDRISVPGPGGGLTWDGRAASLAEQANTPLTSSNEMANENAEAVIRTIAEGRYADRFKAVFGADVFEHPDQAYAQALKSLETFQLEDASFHPYSSKFDRHANNKLGGEFTAAEQRGLRVFVDAKKGNCMACHLLGTGNGGSHDMTTDYSFEAIGVPRNPEIPANADPAYSDLGLCGPQRSDHFPVKGQDPKHYCGLFKTPTLRNIATRQAFMHNGVFHSLRQTLEFYATRDTAPERWYSRNAQGQILKYDDLPVRYLASLDQQMPLDGRAAGSAPPLNDQDIDDLEAFLETLTDTLPVSPDALQPTSTAHP